MQRMLKFGSVKIPKLSKANLMNTEVHLLIQHIHQLLRQEAFDDSVLGNLIVGIYLCSNGDSIPQSHHDQLDD